MKKQLFFAITGLFLLLVACQSNAPDLGVAQNYYPSANLLQKGIVNKYYKHQLPADKKDISTDILYTSLQFSPTGSLYLKNFNPGLKNISSSEYFFENNKTILLKAETYSYHGTDTTRQEIIQPIIRNWTSKEAYSERLIQYDWGSRKWEIEQLAHRDTTILKKPAVIFEEQRKYTSHYNGDTIPGPNTFLIKRIFVQDLGLYYKETSDINGKTWIELVEQIPLNTFKEMANHKRERVAFIKEEDVIDKDSAFKLCGNQIRMLDYYVRENLNSYKGGNRVIRKYLSRELKKSKLFEESGYLTFRFYVNCKGEAGRFVIEQADLDFQRKEFNSETIAHFLELLKGLKEWTPTHFGEDKIDATFYFTFKLKDGELIEIMPQF